MKKLLLLCLIFPIIAFSSTETKSIDKDLEARPFLLGAGVHLGTDGYGIHTRFWIYEVFGATINITNGFQNENEHWEFNLMYKLPIPYAYKPYIFAGGGIHLMDIDETTPSVKNEKIPSITSGLGIEYFFGKKERHSLSIEGAYTWGKAEYTLTNNTFIGEDSQNSINKSKKLTPFSAKIFYTYYFIPIDKDKDKDGIIDKKDQCPMQAEDKDNFEDLDGCPDLDNDKDGIVDTLDKCPLEIEDFDSFQDEDGCPDLDNDQDGILDSLDKCPLKLGIAELEGCPDLDKDKDGITDELDKCPNQAEDKDDFEDEDGCPDLDNDQDGIPDTSDKCPLEKETINTFEDEDGCPDVLKKEMANIPTSQIQFITGSAILKKDSHSQVLDDMVALLLQHPEVKVQISGHTDNVGNPENNQILSENRAKAVANFLIEKGIEKDLLTVSGHGMDIPIATNDTREGRAQNRRVEIVPLTAK